MTRYTASNPAKFANARFKEAQKGVAAGALFAMKTATAPIQLLANKANKTFGIANLKGVNNKPRNRK